MENCLYFIVFNQFFKKGGKIAQKFRQIILREKKLKEKRREEMKGKRVFWFVCFMVILLLFCGCGGSYYPLPSSETTETETEKTARLILRFNFGNSEERAKASDLAFIAESQAEKVEWLSGWLENVATGENVPFYQNLDDSEKIELLVEPGEYKLWMNAYVDFETVFGNHVFCFFEGRKTLVLEAGENPEDITLTLSDFQPVIISLPEPIQDVMKVKGKRVFPEGEGRFESYFYPLSENTEAIGTIPLNATEIKVYFQDKIYSIAPEKKMIDSLIFDEPIILAECPFVEAAIAVFNVGIPDNEVVPGTTGLIALKFKVKALADAVVINDVIRIAKYGDSEYDIDETALTAIDPNGNEIYNRTSPIAHGHAHFYFFSSPLNILQGEEVLFIFSANISSAAQVGNKFSFGVAVISANSDQYEVKEIGPEFTITE